MQKNHFCDYVAFTMSQNVRKSRENMHPPEKTFFQQNIYFSADMKHLPEIVLIDDVTISSPYVHYRRKPEEYIFYYIYDGEMYLTEGDTAYAV